MVELIYLSQEGEGDVHGDINRVPSTHVARSSTCMARQHAQGIIPRQRMMQKPGI